MSSYTTVDANHAILPENNIKPSEYEGSSVTGRYMWHAAKEINHFNPNISAYAKLMVKEFARLEKNEITIEEFEKNTPNIEDETPLNYIQTRIIMHYPK